MRKLKLRGIAGPAQGRWMAAEPRFQARGARLHGPQLFLPLVLPPGPWTHCLWEVAPIFPVACCVTLRLWLPSLGLSFLLHKMWRWVQPSSRPPWQWASESMAIKKQNADQSRSLADPCPGQPVRESKIPVAMSVTQPHPTTCALCTDRASCPGQSEICPPPGFLSLPIPRICSKPNPVPSISLAPVSMAPTVSTPKTGAQFLPISPTGHTEP